MARALFSQYHKDSAESLAERLQKNYYTVIDCLCDCIEKLSTQPDASGNNELYSSLCQHLTMEIRLEMQYRSTTLIPYLQDLESKQKSGHDCRGCSGLCKTDHEGQLQQLKSAHQHIKEILYRIQQVASPLQQDTKHQHPASRIMANEIAQLDTTLTELFYIEEAILIPKIMELQSQIHVGNQQAL